MTALIWQGTFSIECAYDRCRELAETVFALLDEENADYARIASTELLSNAVKASLGNGGHDIVVCWELKDHRLTFEVINYGVRFQPTPDRFVMPDKHAEGGRGLPLAFIHSDGLQYTVRNSSTHVTCYWNLLRRGWQYRD